MVPEPDTNPWFVTVNEPPFVVVIAVANGPTAKLLPAREIPPGAAVFRLPKRVEVPVPASCVIESAVIASTLRLLTLVIRKAPRRVVAPKAPLILISPLPAIKLID